MITISLFLSGALMVTGVFLPWLDKQGGDIVFQTGTVSSSLSIAPHWSAIVVVIAGALIVLAGVFRLIRPGSRWIVGSLALIGGLSGIAVAVGIAVDAKAAYAQVGATFVSSKELSSSEAAAHIEETLENFKLGVSLGVGFWTVLVAGLLAIILAVVILIRRPTGHHGTALTVPAVANGGS